MSDANIPNEKQVNGKTIKVDRVLDMVSVQSPGLLVPTVDATFNVPQDGDLAECYNKAVAFAESN